MVDDFDCEFSDVEYYEEDGYTYIDYQQVPLPTAISMPLIDLAPQLPKTQPPRFPPNRCKNLSQSDRPSSSAELAPPVPPHSRSAPVSPNISVKSFHGLKSSSESTSQLDTLTHSVVAELQQKLVLKGQSRLLSLSESKAPPKTPPKPKFMLLAQTTQKKVMLPIVSETMYLLPKSKQQQPQEDRVGLRQQPKPPIPPKPSTISPANQSSSTIAPKNAVSSPQAVQNELMEKLQKRRIVLTHL